MSIGRIRIETRGISLHVASKANNSKKGSFMYEYTGSSENITLRIEIPNLYRTLSPFSMF
jgi:hypothetical protein